MRIAVIGQSLFGQEVCLLFLSTALVCVRCVASYMLVCVIYGCSMKETISNLATTYIATCILYSVLHTLYLHLEKRIENGRIVYCECMCRVRNENL